MINLTLKLIDRFRSLLEEEYSHAQNIQAVQISERLHN